MLALGVLALGANVTYVAPPAQLDVGVNLPPLTTDGWGIDEWKLTATQTFRDLFKHAQPWEVESAGFDGGERVAERVQYGLEPTNLRYTPKNYLFSIFWNKI